jgi:hypothetical protein
MKGGALDKPVEELCRVLPVTLWAELLFRKGSMKEKL